MKWFLKAFRQFSDFSGRARRTEYWMFFLFNVIFGVAVALRIYFETGQDLYLIGAYVFGIAFFLSKFLQYKHLFSKKDESKDILDYKYYFEEEENQEELSFFSKLVGFFRNYIRSDFIAFVTMFIGFFALYKVAFWYFVIFGTAMFFVVLSQTFINKKSAVS